MKISVENSLIDIKTKLAKEGYEVYDFSDRVPSDIYIYSEENVGLVNMYRGFEPNSNGSLLINAYGKSINDILYSIKRRIYSPLF